MDEANGGRSPAGPIRRIWPVRRRGAADDLPAPAEVAAPEDIAVRDIAAAEAADRLPAPEPEPYQEEPPPRMNLAAVRLGALGLALVLTVALTLAHLFVGGPPSVAQLRAEAGVDGWAKLAIGVKDDQPGVGFWSPGAKSWSGFDIDIAYMIAEDLGFRRAEVQFFAIESEDRVRMQATDSNGKRVPVQMVIASYSITPDRVALPGVRFSAPYLYTEQSVITLKGGRPISSLDDLDGRTVCTLSASTSEAAPGRAGATVRRKNRISDCIAALRKREVDAVSTDAAILAGYKAQHDEEFDHWDLGIDDIEAWGVNTGENEALRDLVDLTLYRSLKDPADDRWETAYQTRFAALETKQPRVPIAQAQQPDVPRPDVRQLPWENVLP
ncbi:transporter substrate-binding domain-containing protein [Jidongwangia harbinensis]|uniref:transporter substrate-binding domain-containing protein n=1 Tax=Jidongwangia harbinensis TaxID=2878561 RepID=UPI001CD96410|nr:transporter substrate-binding domain-containing protein [Jidongwangia harbinensis]MCA2214798.1 transporter substrate-binding domain-containing protein [Jidongwangia harbinensis]